MGSVWVPRARAKSAHRPRKANFPAGRLHSEFIEERIKMTDWWSNYPRGGGRPVGSILTATGALAARAAWYRHLPSCAMACLGYQLAAGSIMFHGRARALLGLISALLIAVPLNFLLIAQAAAWGTASVSRSGVSANSEELPVNACIEDLNRARASASSRSRWRFPISRAARQAAFAMRCTSMRWRPGTLIRC